MDDTGILKRIDRQGRSWFIQIRIDPSLGRYLIEKGSIAVDGISLTVNRCTGDSFTVAIIPLTVRMTTLVRKKAGDKVNIEIDMISKYIEKFVKSEATPIPNEPPSSIDRDMLIRYGFGEGNGHL